MPATIEPKTEQTRQLLNQFEENWMGRKPKPETAKPDEKAKEKPPEPPKEEKKEEAAKEPPKEEVKKPEPAAPVPPKDDGKMIADSLGRAVRDMGNAVKDAIASRKSEDAPKPQVPAKLPPSVEKRQKNLEALEKLFPDEYSGIASDHAKFVERQKTYEEKWLADNPGKEFNPDDDEHDAFFEQDPMGRVENEHLAEAIADQRLQAERLRIDRKLDEVETRQRFTPKAEQEGSKLAAKIVSNVGGSELAGLTNTDGSLNEEKYAELLESDPIRTPVVAQAALAAASLGSEVVKIFNGVVQMDSEKNPLHRQIAEFGADVENRMLQLSPDQWKDARGRRHEDFLPSHEFYAMKPAQRRGKWTFDDRDLIDLMTLDLTEDAKKIIAAEEKKLETVAKRRGFQAPESKKVEKPEPVKAAVQAQPASEKPNSPASTTEPKLAGVKGASQGASSAIQDAWKKLMG